jgi:hypothetical protein
MAPEGTGPEEMAPVELDPEGMKDTEEMDPERISLEEWLLRIVGLHIHILK